MFSFHALNATHPFFPLEEASLDDEAQRQEKLISDLEQTLTPLQEEIERRRDWIRILAKTHERQEQPLDRRGLLDTIQRHQQELHSLQSEQARLEGALRAVAQRQSELETIFVDESSPSRATASLPPDFLHAQKEFFTGFLNPYRRTSLLREEWLADSRLRQELLTFLEKQTPSFAALQEQLHRESEERYPLWPEEERTHYLRATLPHHIHQIANDMHLVASAIDERQTPEDALASNQFATVYDQAVQLLLRSLHRPLTIIPHDSFCAILNQHERYQAPIATRQALVDAVHTWIDTAIRTQGLRSEHALHTKRRYQKFVCS